MGRYAEGDNAAFEALYRRVAPRVLAYLLHLTRHRERAEDLLQVTFTKVHRARAGYLRGAPVLPWVRAIARRSFLDERRAPSSRSELLSGDGSLPEPASGAVEMSTDLAEALEAALDALPPHYRESIELTKLGGLTIAQASSLLGTSEVAIRLRVHRGYAQLRQNLERFARRP